MTTQVTPPPPKKPGMFEQILPMAGSIIGGIYGGPGGAAAGGAAGGAIANSNQKPPAQIVQTPATSPLQRRQESIQSDPATQMRNGKIALASMDAETRKAFEPVLDEGLRRHAQDRKQQYGYGYTGGEIA
jgi:hypothetical protein